MQLFILDVSGFLFRAYFALPPMTNAAGESTHALFGFIRSVLKLLKEHHPSHIVAVYDGPDNKRSRTEIYQDYKANRVRDYEDLPEQIAISKQFCDLMGIHHVELDGVEADDTIGSIATWAAQQGVSVRICTSDKDLCQLVTDDVHLLNPWKDYAVLDPQGVEENFGVKPSQIADYLGMVGDSSDNIPGVPGFGPKTVAPLLQQYGTIENVLAHVDEISGKKKQQTLREEASQALLSKQLATIQTQLSFPQSPNFFAKQPVQEQGLRSFYLQMGFHSLIKELEIHAPSCSNEVLHYHLVDDLNGLQQLIAKMESHDHLAFDCETTSLDVMQALPIGIGFCFQAKEAYYVPFNGKLGEKARELLAPFLKQHMFFGHHTKYDCHVLVNVGIEVAHLSFDTILASYLLNPSARSHSLDNLCLDIFGKVKIPIKDLIGTGKKQISMDQVPLEKVCQYCCEDVDYTFRLKQHFEKQLHEEKLDSLLYDLELPLSKLLLKMERAGVYLDINHLKDLGSMVMQQLNEVQEEVFSLSGESFNLNSPKQLAAILFEKLKIKPLKKTATGYSTNADVLEDLAINYPIAEKILIYRSLEKLRSTYIESLPNQVNLKTERVHPTFNQVVTATGRLACQDPNLQNIPVRTPLGKKIREAFRPQKMGWSYLSADYSQIELRLLAHFSEDPTLINAFEHAQDIHAHTAALMFEKQHVTSEERRAAKAINFGIIYGQQAYGLARELHIDIHKAADFIQAYYRRYPKVFEYIQNSIEQARRTGKAVTMIGRQRSIPDLNSANTHLRAAAERLAVNTPLQGSAADLIKKAMLAIDQQLQNKKLKSFLILQIHDELIFEAPDEELEALKPLVKETMENIFTLKVPLVVDVAIGKNWGQC
ncbi:MAG: DNA polymerase I [Verrucomicrobia bacterium]|nr:DNA polymerase I [Verrucomicrobiota bacterium]MBS0645679.1 DNA polymerase I [Verrucomicrobiota bacterium]